MKLLSIINHYQENPQGGKREVEDDSTRRSNKGNDMTEPSGIQSPEHRHTVPASELASTGRCVRSVSAQQSHTELDSDVSDDTDQDLDIEDDTELTMEP